MQCYFGACYQGVIHSPDLVTPTFFFYALYAIYNYIMAPPKYSALLYVLYLWLENYSSTGNNNIQVPVLVILPREVGKK